jgi:hypothetical protein
MKPGLSLKELAIEIERRAGAKRDLVAPTQRLAVTPDLTLTVDGKEEFTINKVAHDQIAQHTDIPKKYYDKMAKEAPDLLANNINTWFQKHPAVRMVRSLDGTARAFLSDRYRPLENEDLAQAVLPAVMDLGLDCMSSQITDTRLYMKFVDPRVTRELEARGGKFGDGRHNIVRCLAPALTISNSEVGQGALAVMGGVYDQWCSNLASFGERSTRKYHVGGKHEIGGEETYALLSDQTLCEKIEKTQDDKIEGDPVAVVKLTTTRFGLSEGTGTSILRHLIEGGDLSRFGLYNAVTRASQDVEDYDDATAMERHGAQLIELPQTEWKTLAVAA